MKSCRRADIQRNSAQKRPSAHRPLTVSSIRIRVIQYGRVEKSAPAGIGMHASANERSVLMPGAVSQHGRRKHRAPGRLRSRGPSTCTGPRSPANRLSDFHGSGQPRRHLRPRPQPTMRRLPVRLANSGLRKKLNTAPRTSFWSTSARASITLLERATTDAPSAVRICARLTLRQPATAQPRTRTTHDLLGDNSDLLTAFRPCPMRRRAKFKVTARREYLHARRIWIRASTRGHPVVQAAEQVSVQAFR